MTGPQQALIEAISLVDYSPQNEKTRRKYFSKMLVLSVAIFAKIWEKFMGPISLP